MKKLNRIFSFILAVCVMLSSMPTEAFAAFHHAPRTYDIGGVAHQYYIYEYQHTKVCSGCYDFIETAPHVDNDSDGLCDVCDATVTFVGNVCEHIHSTSQPNYIHMDPYGHINQCNGCTGVFGTHTTMNGPSCDDCGWSGPVIGKDGSSSNCSHANTYFTVDTEEHEEFCSDCPWRHAGMVHSDADGNGRCDVCGASVSVLNGKVVHTHTGNGTYTGTGRFQHEETCSSCGNGFWEDHTAKMNGTDFVYAPSPTDHYKVCADCDNNFDDNPHVDSNTDNHCDICGYQLSNGGQGGGTCQHVPKMVNGQIDYAVGPAGHEKICDNCGNTFDGQLHADNDNNGDCDTCGFTITCNHSTAGRWWDTDVTEHTLHCDCGYPVSNPTAHTDAVQNNGGAQGADGLCDECNVGVAMVNSVLTHTHVWSTQPSANNDDSEHFYNCTDNECTRSTNAHTPQYTNGQCDLCGLAAANGGQGCAHTTVNLHINVAYHEDICANCNTPVGNAPHVDTNPQDNKCDDCGATLDSNGQHEHQPDANNWRDLDGVHHRTNCMECGADIDGMHADDPASPDGLCDICGYGTPTTQGCTHTTVKFVTDITYHEKICDNCNMQVGADPHVDTNPADGKCDDCQATVDSNNEHTHIPGTTWVPNNSTNDHESQCTECTSGIVHDPHNDSNPADGTCDICGGVLNSQGGGNPPQGCAHNGGTHTVADTAVHQIRCNDCGTVMNTAAHADSDGDDHCDDCWAPLQISGGQLVHNHTPHPYGWYANRDEHFYKCDTCGMTEYGYEAHKNLDGNNTCDICGVILDNAGIHDCQAIGQLSWQAEDEYAHYQKCNDCNGRMNDGSHEDLDSDDKCDQCNATLDANDVHLHQLAGNWMPNTDNNSEHYNTCTECEAWLTGSHDDNGNGVCADCGYIMNCQHPVNNQWMATGEETHQLHCGDCGDAIDNEYPHENDGNGKCKDCGVAVDGQNIHKHDWSTAWTAGNTGHHHDCTDTNCTTSQMAYAHTDTNNDNACDDCGDTNTQKWCTGHIHNGGGYVFDDGKHYKVCDNCQVAFDSGIACADTDMDHECDVCRSHVPHNVSDEWTDYNGGHTKYCYDCGNPIPDEWHPYDINPDSWIPVEGGHANYCGVCGEAVSGTTENHTDTDSDLLCDDCGTLLDANGTHIHGKLLSYIEKATHGQKCEDCGVKVSTTIEAHYDNNGDDKCDGCQATLEDGKYHNHVEEYVYSNNEVHSVYCDDCGSLLCGESHQDNNGDSVCDRCNGTLIKTAITMDSAQKSALLAEIEAAVNKAVSQGDLSDMKQFFGASDNDLQAFTDQYNETVLQKNEGYLAVNINGFIAIKEDINGDAGVQALFDNAAALVTDGKTEAIFLMDIVGAIMSYDGGEYGMSADGLLGQGTYDYNVVIPQDYVASNRTWHIVVTYDEGATFTKVAQSAKGASSLDFSTDNFAGYFALVYTEASESQSSTTTTPSATPAPTPTPSATPAPSQSPEPEVEMPTTADTSIIDEVASREVVQAVKDSVTVTDEVAKVDADAVQAIVDATEAGETIIIPVTEATDGTVNQAVIDTQALADIADSGKDIVIQFTDGAVKLDAKALKAVTDQAGGADIEIRIETTETETLTDTQKKALENMDTSIVISVQIFSDGKYIGDFKGGNATVMIEFTPEEGKSADDYKVYYVGDDGQLKAVPAKYENGYMIFTTVHFSDYVIVYQGSAMGGETVVQPETPAENNTSFGTLPIIGVLFALVFIVVTMLKKRKTEE